MTEIQLLRYMVDMGVGVTLALVSLIALITVLRGRRADQSMQERLIVMLGQFGEVTREASATMREQTAAINKMASDNAMVAAQQTGTLMGHTAAINTLVTTVDGLVPAVAARLDEHQLRIAAEFKPVVEQLSNLYLAVRRIQDAIEAQQQADAALMAAAQAHWLQESKTAQEIQQAHAAIQSALALASARIEQVFEKVIQLQEVSNETNANGIVRGGDELAGDEHAGAGAGAAAQHAD